MTQWGSQGDGPGEFLNPESIAIDTHNNLYIADTGNHRIQKFSAEGVFIKIRGTLLTILTYDSQVIWLRL
jgi:hypothetical protein